MNCNQSTDHPFGSELTRPIAIIKEKYKELNILPSVNRWTSIGGIDRGLAHYCEDGVVGILELVGVKEIITPETKGRDE
jgi:hypothetical protein